MDIFSYLLGKKASGGGSSKFTFEEGTWTPTEDTSRGEISFTNTHSKPPAYITIIDIGNNIGSDAIVTFQYIDFEQSLGESMTNKNGVAARFKCTIFWNYAASTTINSGGTCLKYGPDTTKDSYTKDYSRYYADEQKFYPTMNSNSRYFLTDRPYKWLAIWVDE